MKAILMLAALAGAPGLAGPAADLTAIERAIGTADPNAATKLLQARVEANRARPDPGPDPLLNGLIGRFLLQSGNVIDALAYLRRAEGPEIPPVQRQRAGMALAAAEERLGDNAAALAALAAIDRAGLSAEEAGALRLQEARLRLPTDPAAALGLAKPLAEQKAARSEAELIAAQALALLGDANGAAAAAQRAWAAAPDAPPEAFAPAKVALVRALLAAARGDRAGEVAMLNAAGAAGHQVAGAAIAQGLPVCGEGGLTPADWASFALFADLAGPALYLPVAASRPAAAKLFQEALAGRSLLADGADGSPGGTTATVRCRTALSTSYTLPPRQASAAMEFMVEHGLYPDMGRRGSLEDINAATGEIETLAARLGDDHPALITLRGELAQWLEARARTEADVEPGQIVELRRKVDAAAAKLGAPPDVLATAAEAAEAKSIQEAPTPEEMLRRIRAGVLKHLRTSPLDLAYTGVQRWIESDTDAPDGTKADVLRGLIARFDARPADPRRRALLAQLGEVLQKTDRPAARARLREAGLADDLCIARETEPKLEEHGITEEDYPPDLVRFSLVGLTTFDAELGPDGHVARSRLTLSSPSGLFDEVVERKIPGIRFKPAAEGGKPRGCRGWSVPIQWRVLEDEPEQEAPSGEEPGKLPST